MHKERYAVGIDIGTENVRVVIAAGDGESALPRLVAAGAARNLGMRKGLVISIDDTAQAVDTAVLEAEKAARKVLKNPEFKISRATASVNGAHIEGQTSHGDTAVSGSKVSEDDIHRVYDEASALQLDDNREILDVTIGRYSLGTQSDVKDPLDMVAKRLSADAYVVTALTPNLVNLENALKLAELKVETIPSGLAASLAMLDKAHKESGVVLVDLGATTTTVVVYEEGNLKHFAVLPIGGRNITNDLAIGLRADLAVAEKVKCEYAVALKNLRQTAGKIRILEEGEELLFDTELVDKIVEARVEEIFELVNLELRRVGRFANLPGGAVLSGGGANLEGVTYAAKQYLRMNAKVGRPAGLAGLSERLLAPEWATALGLTTLDLGMNVKIAKPRSGGFLRLFGKRS